MKSLLVIAVLFLSVGFTPAVKNRKAAHLDKEFTLKIGQSAYLKKEDLTITFESVADDSRCPRGVNCVWAGNAAVVVKVRRGGREAASLTLNTSVNPKTAKYFSYEFSVADVYPYPSSDTKTPKWAYEATLIVQKAQR